jgi:hypothetical protein
MTLGIVGCVVVCVTALGTLSRVQAGAQTLASPAFEVASVKRNPSRTGIRGHGFPADRFEARNVPVRDLIMVAFGEPGRLVPESLMSGGRAGSTRIASTSRQRWGLRARARSRRSN